MTFHKSIVVMAVVLATVPAFAHISYTNRDFGSFDGVMTTTDYLTQVDLLTNARLNGIFHQLQYEHARQLLQAKTLAND